MKDFINSFDFGSPDWEGLPEDFFDAELDSLSQKEVAQYNAIKGLWEILQPKKPESRSRVWKSPNGYIYLVSWSNASLLRILTVKWVGWLKEGKRFPFGWKYVDRLEAQLLDCLRSSVANQEEGYARPTTSEYLNFLGYAQASLKEAKGDFQRGKQDGILKSLPGSSLASLGIDLRDWHEALKKSVISKPIDYRSLKDVTGNYPTSLKLPTSPKATVGQDRGASRSGGEHNSSGTFDRSKVLQGPVTSFNYSAVDALDPESLTYEIFIELVNKTDWQLRRLVESLEIKLGQEQKLYKVEKARIKVKF